MLRRPGLFTITVLISMLGACAVEPVDPAEPGEPSARSEAVEPSEAAPPPGEAAAANCAVVTTCNAAGADGTRCRQQPGCGVAAARLECELEAFVVCGAAVCPTILIRLDGTRENLCGGALP
jgi:hypothetical protein